VATKKDLLEAQKFSRTRLLSAFLGGAPGGKELAPANPLRAVYGSIALTAMVIIAGIFVGFFKPGLPSGWENNRLIVAKDTGARYVSMDSVLYPVVNTVSARLLIPPGEFSVVSVNQDVLGGVEIGDTIGIFGGPDTLPTPDRLDGANWLACSSPEATELWLGGQRKASAPADSGAVVTHEGTSYVIADGKSFTVPDQQQAAVLRAAGLSGATPTEVTGAWLSLFEPADPLAPLELRGAGERLDGVTFPIGTVIHPSGSGEEERYLLTADGELSPLSPLAYRLYQLGDGSGSLGEAVDVSPAELADLPSGTDSGGEGWPAQPLTPHPGDGAPCATLEGPREAQRTVLAVDVGNTIRPEETEQPVLTHVPEGAGAIVQAGKGGTLTLIDPLGMSYAVPGDIGESVARFGYAESDVHVVPHQWLQLLPAGPELTTEAAGSSPVEP